MNIKEFYSKMFGDVFTYVDENNRIWFIGKQIASILGYKNSKKAIIDHVKNKHKKWFSYGEIQEILKSSSYYSEPQEESSFIDESDSLPLEKPNKSRELLNNPNGAMFITEAGLNRLVMRSKLPAADEFQDWIVEEVIPMLKAYGSYIDINNGIMSYVYNKIKENNEKVLREFIDYCDTFDQNYNRENVYNNLLNFPKTLIVAYSKVNNVNDVNNSTLQAISVILENILITDLSYYMTINYDPLLIMNLIVSKLKDLVGILFDDLNISKIKIKLTDNEASVKIPKVLKIKINYPDDKNNDIVVSEYKRLN